MPQQRAENITKSCPGQSTEYNHSPPSLTNMVKYSSSNIPMFEGFCNVNYVCLNIFNLSVIEIQRM